jgi:hypothetical protein
LVVLDLSGNHIEVLEEGLFDFNQKLKFVRLHFNKINKIHPEIFDHLTELTSLYLAANKCINRDVANTALVKSLIHDVKIKCPSPGSTTTTTSTTFSPISVTTTTEASIQGTCKPNPLPETCDDELKTMIINATMEQNRNFEEMKNEMSNNLEVIIGTCESSIEAQRIENIENSLHNFRAQVTLALGHLIGKINDLKEAVDKLNKE